MNKKFLSAILFGALMITSTGTFVSCKDYDDDIDQINTELAGLKGQIEALQNKINSGEWVSSVTSTADGIKVTLGNGQSFDIKNGKDGANGAAGKNGSVVTIDPTTSNWLIDGVDTGVCAKGQNGQAPKINEEGNWEVWNGEAWVDTEMSAIGAQTYVIEYPSYFELNVMEQDAEGENAGFVKIKLPKTAPITDLKAVTITNGVIDDAEVVLYYGKEITENDGLKFNGKTYAKGTRLVSQTSSLSAIVNPLDADAAKYAFKLVDTKGYAPFVVSDIKQNMSEKALSRADKTANQGVWDMTLAFADVTKVTNDKVGGTYALTTETANGVVASPYDVTVKTEEVTSVGSVPFAAMSVEGDCNADIDLAKKFYESNWGKYIVDSYFEITDKTAANNANVSLNGNIIKTTKNETFTFNGKVKGYFLMVNGDRAELAMNVKFNQVAPTQSLADVEWTINSTSKTVYLSLASIQSQLAGNSDTSLPAISYVGSTWADGTALNEKSVLVNGVNYGKADNNPATNDVAFEAAWITSLGTTLKSKNAAGNAYVDATSIQKEMFAVFTFDETTAFPGEYIVKVGFRKNGATTGDYAFVVPVKVTIKAPAQTIVKHENYFTGNNAVAYGAKNAEGTISYNLNELFKTEGLSYAETEVKKADGVTKYTKWLQSGTTIKVGTFQYGNNVDNGDRVYATREYTASIIPFTNAHIQKTEYTFNLTIKSAIKEGTFTSEASKTIETSDAVKFDVTEFKGVDVYGDKFQIGETYEYDNKGNLTKVNKKDARIVNVAIAPADDNAEDYLNITTFNGTFGNVEGEKPAAEYFTVARKTELTQLVEDTPCTIKVTITDDWGVKSEATVTVVLKKF